MATRTLQNKDSVRKEPNYSGSAVEAADDEMGKRSIPKASRAERASSEIVGVKCSGAAETFKKNYDKIAKMATSYDPDDSPDL